MGIIQTVFIILIFCGLPAKACDLEITRSQLISSTESACLADYFANVDLLRRGESVVGMGAMQANDMMTFRLTKDSTLSVESAQRRHTINAILTMLLGSLHNENGPCSLQIWDGDRQVNDDDFSTNERTAEGQPGTRLLLKSDQFENPHWDLRCPRDGDPSSIIKFGDYFMLFIDVYENRDADHLGTSDHLLSYLFSFN